ncbi:MAG TPA: hypothetical protein VMT67_03910 [Terriglobales bacterium]|nr:hypothetical protein [Terriglobales bacterium]
MATSNKAQATGAAQDSSIIRIGGLAVLAALSSFFYYVQRSEILMHGDATAHINIARRVFDSLTPGPWQLGTVWLPLPHILMMPFLVSDKLWQSGIGGSVPSIIAYVLGVLGIARLVGGLLSAASENAAAARAGVWVAALAYGANPNLIYMQTTALTETLYLAFFIWALVYFAEFARQLEAADSEPRRSLRRCACCVACAEMTRYDGWFLAGTVGAIVFVIALRRWHDRALRWSAAKFLVGIAIAPLLWLTYNAVIFGNAFGFANGPYSAKAIELRVAAPNPAFHNYWLGGLYFLKSAQLTVAVGNWGRFWVALALVTTAAALWFLRKRVAAVLILLWSPLAFYAYSLSYGWVPLHVPIWWPHAVFNQRFGLELLPLFSVLTGLFAATGFKWLRSASAYIPTAAAIALIATSYAYVLNAKPLCLIEAERNWSMRRGLDSSLETVLKALPPDSMFLMDLGEHVNVMERLGIPLRRVVNGENHRPWVRPSDPEGIWERTLADPGAHVDYVIAFEGDSVDHGVNRTNLTLLTVIHSMTQAPARIYQTQRTTNQLR